jgi:hypothetical protein
MQPAAGPPGSGVRTFTMLLFGLGAAIVMIGVVLGVALVEVKSLRIGHVHHANLWALAIFLTLVGCVLHLVGRRLERPLDPSSDQSLVGSYRQRFFLWVGCGEAPALVGHNPGRRHRALLVLSSRRGLRLRRVREDCSHSKTPGRGSGNFEPTRRNSITGCRPRFDAHHASLTTRDQAAVDLSHSFNNPIQDGDGVRRATRAPPNRHQPIDQLPHAKSPRRVAIRF